jgi:hypothetical protein
VVQPPKAAWPTLRAKARRADLRWRSDEPFSLASDSWGSSSFAHDAKSRAAAKGTSAPIQKQPGRLFRSLSTLARPRASKIASAALRMPIRKLR